MVAVEASSGGDQGNPIAVAIVAEFRKRKALLPSLHSIEKIGIVGRAIAHQRAETALIKDIAPETLQTLDGLLEVIRAIGQTRFHWLRSAAEAPGASNLVGLIDRTLGIDPGLQSRVPGRWDQMIVRVTRHRLG